LVQAIERDTGMAMRELKADGGASGNAFLMQFQADILDKPVMRPIVRETTALGAAYLAGLAVGFWNGVNELKELWQCDTIFTPSISKGSRDAYLRGWIKAVGRCLDWIE
jgi:glycerol kinase